MVETKPVRVEGDPEGYEAVFDAEVPCRGCDIFRTATCKPGVPCQSYRRPEGRGVHYVRVRNPEPEKGRNAWDIVKEHDSGAWYRSAESSLWFRDWRQAGMIDAVRINGWEYR